MLFAVDDNVCFWIKITFIGFWGFMDIRVRKFLFKPVFVLLENWRSSDSHKKYYTENKTMAAVIKINACNYMVVKKARFIAFSMCFFFLPYFWGTCSLSQFICQKGFEVMVTLYIRASYFSQWCSYIEFVFYELECGNSVKFLTEVTWFLPLYVHSHRHIF